ncbi:MAG: hypothetical protein ACE366_24570 [Bradymonadia bacterium]
MTERALELLMKAVDGLLTAPEQAEFEALLAAEPALKQEYEEMSGVKSETDTLAHRIRATGPRESEAGRRTVGFATTLIVAGTALLAGYATYEFIAHPHVPTVVQVGIGAVAAGVVALLGKVIAGRLSAGRDPYEEIDR